MVGVVDPSTTTVVGRRDATVDAKAPRFRDRRFVAKTKPDAPTGVVALQHRDLHEIAPGCGHNGAIPHHGWTTGGGSKQGPGIGDLDHTQARWPDQATRNDSAERVCRWTVWRDPLRDLFCSSLV